MKKNVLLVICCLVAYSEVTTSALNTLDELAIAYDTDKSSKGHNYIPVYHRYFKRLRNKEVKFLEIGFYKGASARMWEKYFPNAALYFIDNNNLVPMDQYNKDLSTRSHCYVVDQSSEAELRNFINQVGGDFDIIVDDGSHISSHVILSFQVLFPHLKPGGIYVVEDLHASYWKANPFIPTLLYGGEGNLENPIAGTHSAINFFRKLIDDVNFIGSRTMHANLNNCPPAIRQQLTYYQEHIAAMHFYPSLCLIIKR